MDRNGPNLLESKLSELISKMVEKFKLKYFIDAGIINDYKGLYVHIDKYIYLYTNVLNRRINWSLSTDNDGEYGSIE